jgi:hypothetical protein
MLTDAITGLHHRPSRRRTAWRLPSTNQEVGTFPLPLLSPHGTLILCARYVETKFHLFIGNAQNTQLSKAIASGADKGTFVLPKGDDLYTMV